MVGEGSGGGVGGGCFVAEIHGGDEAVVEGEDVEDFAIEEDVALKALDELVNAHAEFAFRIGGDGERFDVGIELGPLADPIGADLFFPGDFATLRGFGPRDVVGHEGEGSVDVALVEGGVGVLDGGGCVGHWHGEEDLIEHVCPWNIR